MSTSSDDDMSQDIISLAVENSLLDMGKPILKVVSVRFREEHGLEFSDALSHPKEFSKILQDLFGDAYEILVKNIEKNLLKSNRGEEIDRFLEAIKTAN